MLSAELEAMGTIKEIEVPEFYTLLLIARAKIHTALRKQCLYEQSTF